MLKSVLIIFMFSPFAVNAQVDETSGIRHTLLYSPTDYFYQLACVSNRNHYQFVPFLGFGINRTIFQQRFYPEAGFQLAYITSQRKLRVLPYAQLSISRLRITNENAHYWLNGELGLRAEFHHKNDFGIQVGYRCLNELWRLNKNMYHATGFGLTAGIYLKF